MMLPASDKSSIKLCISCDPSIYLEFIRFGRHLPNLLTQCECYTMQMQNSKILNEKKKRNAERM